MSFQLRLNKLIEWLGVYVLLEGEVKYCIIWYVFNPLGLFFDYLLMKKYDIHD